MTVLEREEMTKKYSTLPLTDVGNPGRIDSLAASDPRKDAPRIRHKRSLGLLLAKVGIDVFERTPRAGEPSATGDGPYRARILRRTAPRRVMLERLSQT